MPPIPSKQWSKDEIEALMEASAASVAEKFHSDAASTHLTQFVRIVQSRPVQQQINCCQATAVAYALSALGFPTTMDDIFWLIRVSIDSAVGDGMTLAETFDLATRYIYHARLPVFVDCHHFDGHADLSVEDLWGACLTDTIACLDQVLVLNFHSGIAHGWPEGGGGHFSVLLGIAGSADAATPGDLVVADVHPLKYGAYWSAPAHQMFAAMSAKDSCGRARGMLRFGLTRKALARPDTSMHKAPALVDWTTPPSGHDAFLLKRFIPKQWDGALGVANMSGMSAIALATNAVHGLQHQPIDMDACMRTLRLSYRQHLHDYQSSEHVLAIASELARSGLIDRNHEISVSRVSLGETGEDLKQALLLAGAGMANVAIILPIDINVAKGGPYVVLGNTEAAKLSHGPMTWVAVASVNPSATPSDPQGVVVASTNHVIRDGRLWATSLDLLAGAIRRGAVRDEHAVVLSMAVHNDQSKLEELYRMIDTSGDGRVDAQELQDAMERMGVPLDVEEAEKLVAEFSRDGGSKSLARNDFFTMLKALAGYHGDHQQGSARHDMVARFMANNGCVRNELGFATAHMAFETSDVGRNVAFYNHVLGWPLYTTVARGHAGRGQETYGSSWVSYGAFGSFIVFQGGSVPIGAQGHGPWSNVHDRPAPLAKEGPGGLVGSIAFRDVPPPFFGCILEASFFEKQMARIREKDPAVKWLEVTDVRSCFGGGEVERAIALKDPDGYPLLFFVSTRVGDTYTERFPTVPFVYAAHFRVSPSYQEDVWLIHTKITKDMRAQLMNDQLKATKRFFTETLGCKLLADTEWDGRKRLEIEWEGHFICLKSDPAHVPPSLREDGSGNSGHNMGGNRGIVPVPHFGPNTTYASFSKIRKQVDLAMSIHHVPADDVWSLTRTGRAPPFNHLDVQNLLFPKDPDSCLALFLTDPSGNAFEVKWYLDLGQMYNHVGEVSVAGLVVDNSMLADHFPPAIMRLMEERTAKATRAD